jgi:hypothetical protein
MAAVVGNLNVKMPALIRLPEVATLPLIVKKFALTSARV